jgi:hypothetical protein
MRMAQHACLMQGPLDCSDMLHCKAAAAYWAAAQGKAQGKQPITRHYALQKSQALWYAVVQASDPAAVDRGIISPWS